MRKELIIFASLIVLIGLFVVLRPQDTAQLPVDKSNESQFNKEEMKGITNVESFSDAKKNATSKNRTNVKAKPTPKPLPYPRISINYSIRRTSSIGSTALDKNNTFIIVTVDIRNYGYKYFDAHLSKFRMGKNGEIRPIINISAGKMIDAVIPNNSRAKGNIIFLVGKNINQGKLAFAPANKSDNYYIIYRPVSQSEMNDIQKQGASDDESRWDS